MSHHAEIHSTFLNELKSNFTEFWQIGIIYISVVVLLRIIEVLWIFQVHPIDYNPFFILLSGLLFDFEWAFYILGLLFLFYIFLSFFIPKTIHVMTRVIISVLIITHVALVFIFTKDILPIGKELFAYSLTDMFITFRFSEILSLTNLILVSVIFLGIYYFTGKGKWISPQLNVFIVLSGICYTYLIIFNLSTGFGISTTDEVKSNLRINKSNYLYNQFHSHFSPPEYVYFDFFLDPSD